MPKVRAGFTSKGLPALASLTQGDFGPYMPTGEVYVSYLQAIRGATLGKRPPSVSMRIQAGWNFRKDTLNWPRGDNLRTVQSEVRPFFPCLG